MRGTISNFCEFRIVIAVVEDVCAGFEPIVGERRLQMGDHRPFDLIMKISPILRVLGIARPLVSNSYTPNKTETAIYD